jgi:LPXTG-motif cell wall-anchored protein
MRKKSLFFLLCLGVLSLYFCLISPTQPVQATDKTSVGVRFSETKSSETTDSSSTTSSSKPSTSSSTPTTTSSASTATNLPKTGSTNQPIYLYIGVVIVIVIGAILLYRKRKS